MVDDNQPVFNIIHDDFTGDGDKLQLKSPGTTPEQDEAGDGKS